MNKIWNGMMYGNTKTKLFLWGIFVLGLLSLGALIFAVAVGSTGIGIGAVCLAFVTFIISQSVSLETLKKDGGKKRKKGKNKKTSSKAVLKYTGEKAESEKKEELLRIYAAYNAETLKKIMHRFKIKKDHKTVMVDSWSAKKIKQCPAFIWETHGVFHILLIGKEPQEEVFAMSDFKSIKYRENVPANPDEDYAFLKEPSLISKVFSAYQPGYTTKEDNSGHKIVKNLYILHDEIAFTNTSAANLFQVVNTKFELSDSIMKSERLDSYFKEAYKWHVMCKDGVITREKNQEILEKLLKRLADDPIADEVFVKTMRDMGKHSLITTELMIKYTQYRKGKQGTFVH